MQTAQNSPDLTPAPLQHILSLLAQGVIEVISTILHNLHKFAQRRPYAALPAAVDSA
jgi:hypothetical protein